MLSAEMHCGCWYSTWSSCSQFDKPYMSRRRKLSAPPMTTFFASSKVDKVGLILAMHIWLAWCSNARYYSNLPEPEPPFQNPRSATVSPISHMYRSPTHPIVDSLHIRLPHSGCSTVSLSLQSSTLRPQQWSTGCLNAALPAQLTL